MEKRKDLVSRGAGKVPRALTGHVCCRRKHRMKGALCGYKWERRECNCIWLTSGKNILSFTSRAVTSFSPCRTLELNHMSLLSLSSNICLRCVSLETIWPCVLYLSGLLLICWDLKEAFTDQLNPHSWIYLCG